MFTMPMTEKNALGRVLLISKEAYSALVSGNIPLNEIALLDSLSAALSHCNNEQKPLGKLMGVLKREIKAKNKPLYPVVKKYFARIYPIADYDFDKAMKHVPAIIYGNDKICAKLVEGEKDKAKSMCDAMKSYPGFLFGEFEALSDSQFYDLVFGYYPKLYGEDFMENMKNIF
jgi:hypothetical protein